MVRVDRRWSQRYGRELPARRKRTAGVQQAGVSYHPADKVSACLRKSGLKGMNLQRISRVDLALEGGVWEEPFDRHA